MSEYSTFIFGKDDFTVPDLKEVQFKTEADLESMTYKISAKCGLDTTLGRILELLDMGMNFKITLADGKKYNLKLEPVE